MIYKLILFLSLPMLVSAQNLSKKYYFVGPVDANNLRFTWDKALEGKVVVEMEAPVKGTYEKPGHFGELQVCVGDTHQKFIYNVFHQHNDKKDSMYRERKGATVLPSDFWIDSIQLSRSDSTLQLSFDILPNKKIGLSMHIYWSADDWDTPQTDVLLEGLEILLGQQPRFKLTQQLSLSQKSGFVYFYLLDEQGKAVFQSKPMRVN